jgi:hypothetical protein
MHVTMSLFSIDRKSNTYPRECAWIIETRTKLFASLFLVGTTIRVCFQITHTGVERPATATLHARRSGSVPPCSLHVYCMQVEMTPCTGGLHKPTRARAHTHTCGSNKTVSLSTMSCIPSAHAPNNV